MATWLKPQDASLVLDEIRRTTRLNPDGSVALVDIQHYESALSILDGLIKGGSEVPTIESGKAVRHAVLSGVRANRLTAEHVIASIDAAERTYLSQPSQNFVLLSSVSVQFHRDLKVLQFQGSRFLFSGSRPFRFQLPASVRPGVHYGPEPTGYTVLRVSIYARCPHSAVNLAMQRLDFLRGLWNFSRNFGSWRRSIGKPAPVNDIVLGPVHTIHRTAGESASDTYWWEPTYIEPIRPTDIRAALPRLRSTLKSASRKLSRSPISRRVEDAVIRYGRALDERNLNDAFIRLWGVLEDLTGVGERDSHEVVVRRASSVLENPPYERVALHRLRKWRNKMVHEGESAGAAESLVYDLKWYVEVLLHFALVHARNFENWDEYCHILDLPPNAEILKRRARLMRIAQKQRESYRQAAV